ncbi:hypothetical protein EC973_004864 [Apophysomyces ossiformis]|uniref:F-box domain-containing protein n=1 Tax=Apophysomyces ossiformis TaxID=679940 RepID=A0A8H7BEA4_9FUNG|nr:hypothetical protein EC973_004864 [Apophysomyces ossiformis]
MTDKGDFVQSTTTEALPDTRVNDLPNEILVNIADRLPKRTLCVLIRLCRSWYRALMPRLYQSITIDSEQRLRQFLSVMLTPHSHEKIFPFVHELHALPEPYSNSMDVMRRTLYADITGDTWFTFFQRCEHLKLIAIQWYWSKHMLQMLASSGNVYRRLARLSIHMEAWPMCSTEFSDFPSVKQLSINLRPMQAQDKVMSFVDLENIHKRFPNLEYFQAIHLQVSGELPQPIAPCNTVRKFIVCFSADGSWSNYFAQKYPRLEIFGLNGCRTEKNEIAMEVKRLVRSCYCLRRLEIFNDQLYCELTDILMEIGAPLEELSVKPMNKSWLIRRFHSMEKTLTNINLSGNLGIEIQQLLAQLKNYGSLRTLSLENMFSRVEPDFILSEMERLEKLVLEADSIGVTSNDGHRKNIHSKLKHFAVTGKEIEDEVYHYLSAHCPFLKSIECDYRASDHRLAIIYYPNPGLKSLKVRSYGYNIYRLTQMNEEERIQLQREGYSKFNELKETRGYTQWIKNPNSGHKTFMVPNEVTEVLREFCYLPDGTCRRKTKKERIYETSISYIHPISIILIRCHYIDEIQLDRAILAVAN